MSNVNLAIANNTVNKLVSAADFNITNKELIIITNDIIEFAYNMRVYGLKLASKVAYVYLHKDEILTDFGGDFDKFGYEVLGWKKAQLHAVKNVGVYFLDADGNCILPESENSTYNKTQLQAMLPLLGSKDNRSLDVVNDLTGNETITPDMTVAEIKTVVSEYRPDKKDKEARAEKRVAAKNTKQKKEQDAESKMYGDVCMTIQIRHIEGTNKYHVRTVNDDGTWVDISTENVGKYLIKLMKAINK